jgi:hypothetical protein
MQLFALIWTWHLEVLIGDSLLEREGAPPRARGGMMGQSHTTYGFMGR